MATLILLGGNHVQNKQRIKEVDQELLPFYDTTHIHIYRHWSQKSGNMDIEYECEQLANYLKTLSGSIILFCKSLGCMLGLKTMVEKDIFIKQCIFIGFPLSRTQLHTFPVEKYLKELTCPVLWIQKTNDPAGGYTTIVNTIGSISPAFTCKEISGDDHEYKEIKVLKQIILDNNAR